MNIKINLKENIILIYSILFISSALIGIFINYSPIPEADFWSIFDHIYALDQGNWKHIFNQHNEHRPAIIYLLTYLDYRFFGNSFYLNYLIIFISFIFSAFLFNKIFNNHHKKNSNINKYYFLLILCFVFFWSQKPNFIFPFHISIIWVNLFILTALYFYKKFHDENNKFYFLYSIIFSVLSIFTVVTGIFAFPLLVLYSFLIKKFKETIFFICLSCLSFYLYFNNFNFVSHHSNFWELNLDNFLKIYLYFFGYLGSIFSFMFGKGYFGLFIAIIFGHIFMYLTFSYFYNFFKNKSKNSAFLYLYLFLLLVLLSAFLTSLGRFEDGVLHSISSRYTTNSIYGWVLLFIIFSKPLKKIIYGDKHNIELKPFLIFILVLLSHNQLKAFKVDYSSDKILSRSGEIIALTLGINIDNPRIPHINKENIGFYIKNKISFFNKEIFLLPTQLSDLSVITYMIESKNINNLKVSKNSLRGYKEIYFTSEGIDADIIYFKDKSNKVSGYAISNNNFKFIKSKSKVFFGYENNSDDLVNLYQ